MTKVLLTGGSGFIAAHILEQLLSKGHKVVTTVRSEEKAKLIRDAHSDLSEDQLKVLITPDIAQPDAYDEAVKVPGIEVVLHTASPFHYNFTEAEELLGPAVVGTTSILKAIVRDAPSVKRVVVTSSFAAILSEKTLKDPNTTYTEAAWNDVTREDAHRNKALAYRASKTLAERAAWDFVADKSNGAKFTLATVNPPLVLGPVVRPQSLDKINTSNERVRNLITGAWRESGVADTGVALNWVDVRDCAEAHIFAGLDKAEQCAGKRLWTNAGEFSNREIYEAIRKNFPEFEGKLPPPELKGGEKPPQEERYRWDASKTYETLGIQWKSLEESIVDAVKSLKPLL